MKKMRLFFGLTALGLPLFGQAQQSTGIVYQQAGVMSVQAGAAGAMVTSNGHTMVLPAMIGSDLFSPEIVTGSPLSATHESHSLQVLGDGTRIERTESQQVYRDSLGRTRIESGPPGTGQVVIQDPVGGVMAVLDPSTKTAQKMPAPPRFQTKIWAQAGNPAVTQRLQISDLPNEAAAVTKLAITGAAIAGPANGAQKPAIEELPAQNVNGVLATGRRTTLTIPTGQIGNDRPIQVVGESWYSSDLQMMVKSSNSDPRFGDTSYELTNILRNEPDPALFQVPSDYTVSEDKPMQFKLKPAMPAGRIKE